MIANMGLTVSPECVYIIAYYQMAFGLWKMEWKYEAKWHSLKSE
jgi:hypothetical protein